MPFYEALKYLLTTSSGSMISRKGWVTGVLMKSSFKECISGDRKQIIVFTSDNYLTDYHANSEDMMADDWYIVKEDKIMII